MSRPSWVPDTVFYQIFPDRFRNGRPELDPLDVAPWGSSPDRDHFQGGDLRGMIEGLDHLSSLGVSGLYLNPIFAAGTNHRYDTHDYYTVDPRLGDLGELKELMDEAHHLGIKVVLDAVFNHCGDGHPAFLDWKATGDEGDHAGWFIGWDQAQPNRAPSYQTCGGADYLPKLNTEHPDVRDHLLRCATFWIEQAGIDGWRLDVPWKIEGGFWDEFAKSMQSTAPEAYIVGEVWRDATRFLDRFDGCTNYQQRAAIIDYCIDDRMDGEDFMIEVEDLLHRHGNAAHWMLNLVGSHDTPRIMTVAGGDTRRVLLALTAMFTLPGAPLIYYGDEIGLEGGPDPDCRRAMPWDTGEWNRDILEHVRLLAQIRRDRPSLRRGDFRRLVERNGLSAFMRRSGSEETLVILNPRGAQRQVDILVDGRRWTDLLTGSTHHGQDGSLTIERVPAQSAMILSQVSQ
jgi:glycosidase